MERTPPSPRGARERRLQDEIVALRKELTDHGFDAGAHTIGVHLARRHGAEVATIWRVLTRRGFVIPQPQKGPKRSLIRFDADMPNERWQVDITHVRLDGGTEVEVRAGRLAGRAEGPHVRGAVQGSGTTPAVPEPPYIGRG